LTRIDELERLAQQLQHDLDYQTEARVQDAKYSRASFLTWRKAHHDPLKTKLAELAEALEPLRGAGDRKLLPGCIVFAEAFFDRVIGTVRAKLPPCQNSSGEDHAV
jgi:hypothetical protein